MTKKMDRAAEIERIAQGLIDNDILLCQSGLIDALLGNYCEDQNDVRSAFSHEEIKNLTQEPRGKEWTIAQCEDFIKDAGLDYSRESLPTMDQFTYGEGEDEETDADAYLEALYNFIENEQEPQEPLEWHAVTKYLAEELDAIGEPIIDNDYGYWWGRTTSGQMIIADGVMQRIAANILARTTPTKGGG